MAADTRQRMIEAAADLLQRGGLEAASFSEVIASSGAARGAIYHHFPEGKHELTREAVTWTGERIRHSIAALEGAEPAAVVGAFLDRIRIIVREASQGRSCAVAAVVVEAGQRDDGLTAAAGAALASWVAALRDRLLDLGVEESSAHRASTLLVVFLEGTQVLCRAVGDIAPFDDSRGALEVAIGALLTGTSTTSG